MNIRTVTASFYCLDILGSANLFPNSNISLRLIMDLRAVTMDDAKLLFDWINDPDDRANSLSQEPIQWDRHLNWIKARLGRANPDIYIAEIDGMPIGTFRIDGDEISYAIAPGHRKKGNAKRMLELAVARFGPLHAEIMMANEPSIKAAEHAGLSVTII